MAEPERDETGAIKGKPGELNVVGENAGYTDEPPRMMIALHDSPRDMPDDTEFTKDGGAIHKAEEITAAALTDVLDWVRKGLAQDLTKLWEKQKSQVTMWAEDPAGLDEQWAQRFSERYFGITYGGPGQAYFGDGIWDGFIFSRVQAVTRKVRAFVSYVQKDGKGPFVRQLKGGQQVGPWQTPEKFETQELKGGEKAPSIFGALEPNDDPALAIVGACQQTTSYGAVTRGFLVEDHLSNAGYAASESSGALSMFTTKGMVVPDSLPDAKIKKDSPPEKLGTFYTLGSKLANGAVVARTDSGGMSFGGETKKGQRVGSNAFEQGTEESDEKKAARKKAEDEKKAADAKAEEKKKAEEAGDIYEEAPDSAPKKQVFVTTDTMRSIAFATDTSNMDPPVGPGTIITYNPHGFVQRVEGLWLYSYETEDWGAQMKVRAELCRQQRGNPEVKTTYHDAGRAAPVIPMPAEPPKKKGDKDIPEEERDAMRKENEERWARWTSEGKPPHHVSLELPKSVQDPGSHIAFILRVSKDASPDKKRIQMFDTGNQQNYWILEAQGKKGLTVRPIQAGIWDGCGMPSVSDPSRTKIPCNSTVTGIGVVPTPDAADQQAAIAAMEKARPVGLCRLVLTLRKMPDAKTMEKQAKARKAQAEKDAKKGGKALDLGGDLDPGHLIWGAGPSKDDVLYVSKLLRMYGDDPSQNFYLSRLVWSLRNTPYFTNVQPWWFVYVPKGVLAKAMWSKGARGMTIQSFLETVLTQEPYRDKDFDPKHPKASLGNPFKNCTSIKHASHYQLTHVITNTGSEVPERAGMPYFYCRMRSSLSDGGSTSLNAEGWKPPSAVWKIVEAQSAVEEYIHPSIKGAVVSGGGGCEDEDAPGAPAWSWFEGG